MQKLCTKVYVASRLGHRYKNSTLEITICLTVTKYPYLSLFCVLSHCFLCLLSSPPPPQFQEWRACFPSCPIVCLCVPCSVLWCQLRFPHKNDFRFVFTPFDCRRANVLRIMVSSIFSYYMFYLLIFVLWCPLRFPDKTIFCSSLPPFVCRRANVLLCCLCLFAHSCVQHVLTIWVTWQCLIRVRKYLSWVHLRLLVWSVFLIFFLCCVVLCFVCLCRVSCVPYVASVSGLSILDCPLGFL